MSPKSDEHKSYNEEKQGELFVEFQAQSTKKPHYFFRRDIALGKKITLNLSYENFVLFFIVIIMLLVVFFSLGVEKGKRVALRGIEAEAYSRAPELIKIEESLEKKRTEVADDAIDKNDESLVTETGEIIEKKEGDVFLKPYTIQVVAFKNEENAEKEMQRLKNEGYEVFILPSKGWFQVCIGRYTNRGESKEDFDILKNRYPSCYFRKIE